MSRFISSVVFCTLIVGLPVLIWADDWPQWRGLNRDGVWHETGIVDKFESKQLKLRWRVPISAGYSGPTVADGRLYVTDRLLDPQRERILCYDAKSGKQLWHHTYPCRYANIGYTAGPRACVTVYDGRAYALGAMGHLHCLDAGTGAVLWSKDLNKKYKIEMPIWGVSAAPLIHDDLLILQIGGRDACVVAFGRKDGDERWTALAKDRACYSAPIMIKQAGRDVVVFWTGDSVAGITPRDGEVHWRFPFAPKNMPIGVATPVVRGRNVFVSSFYDGALMLRLNENKLGVSLDWKEVGRDEQNTRALHSMISTPVFRGDHIYGVDSYGELRCLDARTGRRIWEDLTATPKARWSTIHFVQNRGKTWMFNERGELIISRLSPSGFQELSRAKLLEPTRAQLSRRNGVCWAHPAFANKHVFARNDEELVCADLASED